MSDYVVLQKEAAKVYLGGPPLVKMAIDEDADEEELGGAEMHARISGLGDYLAQDEPDALRIGREIVEHLRWRKQDPVRPRRWHRATTLRNCWVSPRQTSGAVLTSMTCWPGCSTTARSRSSNRCTERRWSPGGPHQRLPGGRARQQRHPVQRGVAQGAQFIQMCNRMDVPIIFVQNITGFMVGTRYEQGGIIKDGAKLINAVSNSTVPHITLMVGASYGAGNYGMSGRAYDPGSCSPGPTTESRSWDPSSWPGADDRG